METDRSIGSSSDTAGSKPRSPKNTFSIETIAAYQPDIIMIFIFKEPETLAFYRELQQSAAWQDLKAVRHHRVYQVNSDPWREYSACSHERIIRQASGNFPEKEMAPAG